MSVNLDPGYKLNLKTVKTKADKDQLETIWSPGALKRGPCMCSTFKAFNLTYLHILRS